MEMVSTWGFSGVLYQKEKCPPGVTCTVFEKAFDLWSGVGKLDHPTVPYVSSSRELRASALPHNKSLATINHGSVICRRSETRRLILLELKCAVGSPRVRAVVRELSSVSGSTEEGLALTDTFILTC